MTVARISGRGFYREADIQHISEAAARHGRTLLPARIYDDVFPLLWPNRSGKRSIIAFIAEASAVRENLARLDEPTSPPRLAAARGPPLWERNDAGQGDFDPRAQPAPDYEFDQRIA